MKPIKFMQGYLSWIILAVLAIVCVGFLWSWINSPLVVTVTGRGEIDVPATQATLTLSLMDNHTDPQTVVNLVKAKAETIRDLLTQTGVAAENIFTSEPSVVPSTQAGAGYQALISMGAKKIPVTSLDTLVPNLYKSGASLVTQPVISIEDEDKLENQAVDKALSDANKQASALALKHWKFIKKVTAVVESPTQPTSITSKTNEQVPSTSGTYKVIKTVTVSYRMW